MAWWKSHVLESRRIPCAQNNSSIVGVGSQSINDFGQLIVTFACVVCIGVDIFCPKVSPLEAVNWTEISFPPVCQAERVKILSRSISFPYFDALLGQFLGICLSSNKPEKFVKDTFEKHLFGCQ
ncbi:hypothetical protein OGATHE_006494 [Ogataea polymorpha]|uniref:Uncharacterized protein n=1 Tax=Ogataea polymorpha TaxID=460523 RepID=A0A9P8NRC0_9ASCO|nr:hypothetical protein OGATHE_006494 [Ogataea polymorpha]